VYNTHCYDCRHDVSCVIRIGSILQAARNGFIITGWFHYHIRETVKVLVLGTVQSNPSPHNIVFTTTTTSRPIHYHPVLPRTKPGQAVASMYLPREYPSLCLLPTIDGTGGDIAVWGLIGTVTPVETRWGGKTSGGLSHYSVCIWEGIVVVTETRNQISSSLWCRVKMRGRQSCSSDQPWENE